MTRTRVHDGIARLAGLAAVTAMLWTGPAEGKRLALVIGNDTYQNASPLQNARSDARAVARALERVGFTVTLKEDIALRELKEALRSFKSQLAGGDEAVFYFSGHGVQFEGTNYLIPTDLNPENEEQVADDAVPLQRVLDDLRDQKTRFAIAIIDACRDNPFKGTGRALRTRGLAPVQPATGQLVLYSAGAGQEALDRLGPRDADPNGVFTRVLIKEMEKPGVPADQMLKHVRDQVVQLAHSVNHEQVPALYDQSIGEFYFVTAPSANAAGPAGATTAAHAYALLTSARTGQARDRLEQDLWERLRQSLPRVVYYANVEHRQAWGFLPATAVSDGRAGAVTLTAGTFRDGRPVFAESDSESWDYKVDCTREQFVPVRHATQGFVVYLTEANRRAETLDFASKPDMAERLVEQVLCQPPLRISPLWAVQELEWTDLGQSWRSALQVRWSDPKRANERYVFSRHDLATPAASGAESEFWWLGVNCATRETRDSVSFAATRSGAVVGLITGTPWVHPPQGSPAANAYVLLCEHL